MTQFMGMRTTTLSTRNIITIKNTLNLKRKVDVVIDIC